MNSLFFIPSGIYIGNLHIAFYAICIIVGAIVAYKLSQHFLKKKGFDPEAIENLFYIAFPCGIVGARIWYVIAQWSAEFASKPWYKVFFIWEGGLAIQGGVIAGVVAGVIFMIKRRPNIPVLLAADCIVPTILIAQAIGRWGNFFNQEAFGTNTETALFRMWSTKIRDELAANQYDLLQKGMEVDPNMPVHPTFLYESVWCIALFLILHFFIKKRRKFKGEIFLLYGIGYGLERMVVEGLRTDSLYIGSTTIRVSQLFSAVVVVVFTIWLIVFFRKLKKGTLARKYMINPPPLTPVYCPVAQDYKYSDCKTTAENNFFFSVK